MAFISKFSQILEDSKREYEEEKPVIFNVSEEVNCDKDVNPNILALGDNSSFMKTLLEKADMAGKIKLIYIDPPFFSKATYDAVIRFGSIDGEKIPPVKYFAYDDVWQRNMNDYLKMLCKRFFLMKDLLAENGTIWIHLDWHVVHYVKVFLDEIFGEENFVNEIVWHYKSGGSGKRHFARKHDTILVYSKSKKYYFAPPKEKSYNRGFKPYRFKGVKEYKDDLGWYTMVTMKDVWNVDMVGRTSAERTGYATQKPEALIKRIIESATEEGDLCADFFCGSGTLGAVAEKMGRRWICCDGSALAVSGTLKRLYPYNSSIRVLEEKERDKNLACQNRRVEFDMKVEQIPGSDKEVIKIYLKNYYAGDLPVSLDEKAKEIIGRIQDKKPTSLLEYWSVDFNFDGEVFRPHMFFSKNGNDIETSCESLITKGENRRIRIKTVDVFGNYTFVEL